MCHRGRWRIFKAHIGHFLGTIKALTVLNFFKQIRSSFDPDPAPLKRLAVARRSLSKERPVINWRTQRGAFVDSFSIVDLSIVVFFDC